MGQMEAQAQDDLEELLPAEGLCRKPEWAGRSGLRFDLPEEALAWSQDALTLNLFMRVSIIMQCVCTGSQGSLSWEKDINFLCPEDVRCTDSPPASLPTLFLRPAPSAALTSAILGVWGHRQLR